MLHIHEMRDYILDYYPNASQRFRFDVEFVMPPRRIAAIFNSIMKREEKKARDKELDKQYHQMTIFEYLDTKKEMV